MIKFTNEEVGALTMALHKLFHAGIGAGDALALLADDEKDGRVRQMLLEMSRRADEGESLSAVLKASGCFPDYVCSLLAVGEDVGKTEDTLAALARYYAGRARMERQLRNALLYPAVLAVVLLAVVVVLLVWVLPVFNNVYAQLGSSLTGFAGVLLALGGALRQIMPIVCLALAAVIIFALCAAAKRDFREKLLSAWRAKRGDKGVNREINEARFAQALSMGLESGLTPQAAVELAMGLAQGAPEFGARCRLCLEMLESGAALAAALRDSGLLPPSESRLLEAGLRAGSGESVMAEIAARLMERSELALEARAGRIEPTLVVVMSLAVGAILLCVMLPLMNIMTAIG